MNPPQVDTIGTVLLITAVTSLGGAGVFAASYITDKQYRKGYEATKATYSTSNVYTMEINGVKMTIIHDATPVWRDGPQPTPSK